MKRNFKKLKQKKINVKALVFHIFLALILVGSIIFTVIKIIRAPGSYSKSDIFLFFLVAVTALILFFSLVRYGKVDTITKISTGDAFTMRAVNLMLRKQLQMYAVLFLNIKNFKHINRILGTVGGDEAMYKYAQKLKKYLLKREYIGRLGGDNFIVLVYKHRLNDLIEFLKNLTIDMEGENGRTTMNIYSRAGVYTLSDRDTVGELFNHSSIALTYAKNSSFDDFVWFQKFMLEETYEEKEIAYMFMSAIQNKNFKVYYQPRINIETNQICGGEALVRWDRDGEILLPDSFLLSLEKTGLITALDFYVMEQVCRDINSWKQKGLSLVPISTNFSRPNLKDRNFVHHIMSVISEYKIEASLYQVEITESFGEDLTQLKSFLEQLHVSGISTMVDNFGIGGFSWTLLKDPNVDAVKLDKSIIENMELNGGANDDALLARNIIHACCDLKKGVICEGVENIAQRDMLIGMRCYEIQGFLYDEPLPIEKFEELLEKKIYKEF